MLCWRGLGRSLSGKANPELLGHVRDYAACVLLTLPGEEGELAAERVVDTGFEGDLALPRSLVAKLERLST